jgi:glycosyltransferase involved in cell wall biosynthesis
MACEKPIVATRVGETPEIIEDGVDGLLVDPGDVDGMTAALLRLVADPDLRRRLAAQARSKVATGFSIEHMTRGYERVYEELVR